MTTRGRSRRRLGRRGPPRQTAWFNQASAPVTLGLGALANFDITAPGEIPEGYQGGFTVLRMIHTLYVRPLSLTLNIFGAYGVLVAPRASLTVLPSPITDLVDWYYQVNWNLRQADSITESISADIRTVRKVRGEQRTLFAVFQNNSASGGSVSVSMTARLLLSRT